MKLLSFLNLNHMDATETNNLAASFLYVRQLRQITGGLEWQLVEKTRVVFYQLDTAKSHTNPGNHHSVPQRIKETCIT